MGRPRTFAGLLVLLASCAFDGGGLGTGAPGGDGGPGGDGEAGDAAPGADAGPPPPGLDPGEARLVFAFSGRPNAHNFIYSSGAWETDGITPPLANEILWLAGDASAGGEELLAAITSNGDNSIFRVLRRGQGGFSQQWSALRSGATAAQQRFGDATFTGDGGALAAYAEGDGGFSYRTRPAGGTGWNEPVSFPTNSLVGAPVWVELAPVPGGDEAVLGVLTENGVLGAAVWTGGSWEAFAVLDTGVEAGAVRSFDVAFETGSRDALIAWGDGSTGTLSYASRSPGGLWSAPQAENGLLSAVSPDHVELTPEPGTDRIALVTGGTRGGEPEIAAAIWDGSSWTDGERWEGFRGAGAASFGMKAAWLAEGAAVVAYASETSGEFSWASWTGESGWSEPAAVPVSGLGAVESLRMAPIDGRDGLLCVLLDDAGSLFSLDYGGSDWTSLSPSPLEDVVADDPVGPAGTLPFALAVRPGS